MNWKRLIVSIFILYLLYLIFTIWLITPEQPLGLEVFGTTLLVIISYGTAFLLDLAFTIGLKLDYVGTCFIICMPNTIGWIILGIGNSFVIWIIYKLLGLFKKSQ